MSLIKRLEEKNIEKKQIRQEKEVDPYVELKAKIQNKVIDELDINFKDISEENEEVTQKINSIILKHIEEESLNLTNSQKKKIREELLDEIIGFGPITQFLKDNSVTEIMVNGPNKIYVERNGKLTLTDAKFKNDDHVMHVIKKIVSPLGRRIDESSPMVDARLPNGSRVNAIIPPLAIDGPSITIRKFSDDPFTVDDLIRFGTLTSKMAEFLKYCVQGRLNIVVSGGTGSGKTTTLNVLSSFIPNEERIITIEDAAELQLSQEHVVRLETRPANLEGKGEITIRDLVKNSLRMRPDRIVVGEVRSGEALDMLQAMNTGHDGSLTTGHANSPRDMLSRLETMVLMSGMNLPVRAIRDQIASAIDLIIQQSRLMDGSRKITHITEVQGMEGDVIILQDIFRFEQRGVDNKGKVKGEFVFTGVMPKFIQKLKEKGINIPQEIFM
ncbi:CpaF family protein [Thermobrachium celere]|uniref:Type II/IV secretion system ATP hydrolase TadA/VirB11/CpaF, TadA subfamily n=1 Tax=Thermobrachium celere DSM 8682 TaxID=941824 RepID=R7RTL6_9CLOT|nr:CpaF family protein [Thermobrachium celere]GFR35333.1 type II secretion system protein E [Thermobrachium celere]CDF58756.1 Type II/IV secretion system ATP hydrolase TadA/VirB11/CpaF, TadA subfamily [Thermobrachium celere DSM 8682]